MSTSDKSTTKGTEPLSMLLYACAQALSLLQGDKEFKGELSVYELEGMDSMRIQRVTAILDEALRASQSLARTIAKR